MKVLRAKSNTVTVCELKDFFGDKGLSIGDKFCVSWKLGKRRKIRKYKIIAFNHTEMYGDDADYAPPSDIVIHLRKGIGMPIYLNNFFGYGDKLSFDSI